MPRRFIKSINNLRRNSNIFITKADKSNSFVVLDSDSYIDKMHNLLSDSSTYRRLHVNPLENIIKCFNKEMKNN